MEKTLILGKRARGEVGNGMRQLDGANEQEFEQTLKDSEGQGSLACCKPWSCEESDTTEQLNNKGGSVVKNPPANKEIQFDPWGRKIFWGRKWQPTPVFLPGKCHGQRSLAGYSIGSL